MNTPTEALTWTGVRHAAIAATTHTLVVVGDAQQMGIDTWGWVTLCDDHSNVVIHHTLRDARGWAPHPEQWCDHCRDSKAEIKQILHQPSDNHWETTWAAWNDDGTHLGNHQTKRQAIHALRTWRTTSQYPDNENNA